MPFNLLSICVNLTFMNAKDGIHILKEKVKQAPESPGVYRMLNENGDVLYVGKAKNLKKRLLNYAQGSGLSNRIRKMVFETRELILVEVTSESEALLLEISLIKNLKPKYNISFRDDTSYPYILLTDAEAPRLMSLRGSKKLKGQYFGPYPDAGAMYRTMEMLEKSFLIRTCKDSEFQNRTRPCLKYHIKRCSAPCVNRISPEEYKGLVKQASRFLKGQGTTVQKEIQGKMLQASQEMAYEQAAMHRDRLEAIASTLSKQSAYGAALENGDVVAIYKQPPHACVQIFSYQNGQHIGNAQFYPKGTEDLSESDALRLFIAMHYSGNDCPKEIITSHEVADAEALSGSLVEGKRIRISTPQKGEKKQLVSHALLNAQKSLQRKLSEESSWVKQMAAFSELLNAPEPLKRIECYDISNIQGKQAVASMVVAGEGAMLKSDYRKFAIKGKDTPDDYAMMREVLNRRYSRLLKESDEAKAKGTATPAWPDVVMVDGGKGHLGVLVDVMTELGLVGEGAPVLLAIAKGEYRDKGLETIFQSGRAQPLEITYNSPLKFLLQVIRDESHRFAIGFHRQKRSKETFKSVLDGIPGVGGKRKKALLLTFGSASGVKSASIEDLKQVDGISEALAQHIYDYLNS
jgi:excinuclease ABC subunit C